MSYEFEQRKLYHYLGADLVELLKKHRCYIAGGAITSLFCNRDINDIDVYFRDQESLIAFLEDVWDERQWIVTHTNKATLLQYDRVNLQLIHFAYFADASAIFDTFDFTACMGCYDFASETFTLHDDFLQHNAQRILKFNKHTAFPIVSLLRVQKYCGKGYTISKPEFIRIILACMNLNITSFDQLKEQMGGMYGVNYDKLFTFDDDTPFSLDAVIDTIADLCMNEDYFKQPVGVRFDSVDDIIDMILCKHARCFHVHGQWYMIRHDNTMRFVGSRPAGVEVVDAAEYFDSIKFYKFVHVTPNVGVYQSFYDPSFIYKIGEVAVAHGQTPLFFEELPNISDATYISSPGGVVIEVSIVADDFVNKNGHVCARKCTVLREVPPDEYERYLRDEQLPF